MLTRQDAARLVGHGTRRGLRSASARRRRPRSGRACPSSSARRGRPACTGSHCPQDSTPGTGTHRPPPRVVAVSSRTMKPAEPSPAPASPWPRSQRASSFSPGRRADTPHWMATTWRPSRIAAADVDHLPQRRAHRDLGHAVALGRTPDGAHDRSRRLLGPSSRNHSAPRAMMDGTLARVSTLFTSVGAAGRHAIPSAAIAASAESRRVSSTPRRYGGTMRGNGERPSSDSSSAVSSP